MQVKSSVKRVLLIGPNFYDYNKYIDEALNKLGMSVYKLSYDTPVNPYTIVTKVVYKFCLNKTSMQTKSRKDFSKLVALTFDRTRPDFVFILNGDMLTPSVVEKMRHSAKVIVWLFDSITHIPYCWNILPECDRVYCYEQHDIPMILSKLQIHAGFLPQAANIKGYHPIKMDKDLDIVFAADLWKSERRKRLIQHVVREFPNLKIKVWGVYKPWYKGLWTSLTRERRDIYTNCYATTEQLNLDYNRAKVVLNIHHEQQIDGANPKVFEIAASGAYEVCDANPYLEKLFPEGEIGLYHDERELDKLIRWAINPANAQQREHRAKQAHNIVATRHTFEHRIKAIFEEFI